MGPEDYFICGKCGYAGRGPCDCQKQIKLVHETAHSAGAASATVKRRWLQAWDAHYHEPTLEGRVKTFAALEQVSGELMEVLWPKSANEKLRDR